MPTKVKKIHRNLSAIAHQCFSHIVLYSKIVLMQKAHHLLSNTVGKWRKSPIAHFERLFFGESLKYPQKDIFIKTTQQSPT